MPRILNYYHIANLELIFDGFEHINPNEMLYYFHNPKNGELYVILLADYIMESVGDTNPGRIADDYWPEHECDWEVQKWIPHNNHSADLSDFRNWLYKPECGDKCAVAKINADISALGGRILEKNMPHIDEAEMATGKARRNKLTVIDSREF